MSETFPDSFGNSYMLKTLIEVTLPDPISWWPATPGWLIISTLLLAYLGHRSYLALKHWWRNRYRREALLALSSIAALPPYRQAMALSQILKQVACYAYPKTPPANLWGAPWLRFLDQTPGVRFDNSLGQRWQESLIIGEHRCTLTQAQLTELMQHSRQWLLHHQGERHD